MIQVENLRFKYPQAKEYAVKNISFSVKQGEILGFLGPNGAGKSTTQKILIGLLKEYEGSAQVNGQEIKKVRSDYYEGIGVSFEYPNHYSKLTGFENLKLFASLYSGEKKDIMELLKIVDLEKAANTKVVQYSKGMRMRLTFARSLIHNPEILFLDEPTSGLDPVSARMIKDLILDLKSQGKTVFLTTHNMAVADELCDRVAFIVDGEIKLIDSPRNLKINKGKRIVKVEYANNGSTAYQEFPLDELKDNKEFLTLIQEKTIETIHTEESSLEKIFIETTGRRLE